jgi:hypothetical protein
VRQDFIPLFEENKPPPFKEYSGRLPRIALPGARGATAPAALLLGGVTTVPGGRTANLDDISAILARCAGLKQKSAGSGEYFRAVSSAGNRHPYEVYVCARAVDGLADGVWHYEPRGHALTLIGPPPAAGAPALIVSGVPWRSCWRYAERGYRHVGWDCGTVASHALLAASACGLRARLETAFDDAAVGRLIGARDHEEVPMLVVRLGESVPAVTPAGEAEPGGLGVGAEEFPLVKAMHEAGNLRGPAEVERWREHHAHWDPLSGEPVPVPAEAGREALDVLVSRRRSARRFDAGAGISQAAARWIIDMATAAPPWDAGRLHDVRVVAHSVSGMPAGVYRPAAGSWARSGPGSREATYRACLHQEPGRDAATVIFITPAPGPAVAGEARAYRAALLAAGFALGRMYLAATALRLACSGLTFVDSDLPAAIGAPAALAAAGIGWPNGG